MSDEIKVNRSQSQSSFAKSNTPSEVMAPQSGSDSSKTPWIILGVVIIVLILAAVIFRGQLFGGKGAAMMAPANNTTAAMGSSGYQAVFLTNGQVYFGKLTNADGDYPVLTDIYYLQVVQPPLQGQQQAGQTAPATGAQPSISLVKLGNELHGPVDEMHIAKTQILFYEDMKTDSQVVKAIESYKANPNGTTAPTTPTK